MTMSNTQTQPVIHAFNTGRYYSPEFGQRIAWAVLSTGNVAMYDIDRDIPYVLQVKGRPSDGRVLAAYDAIAEAPFDSAEQLEAFELKGALRKAAECTELRKPQALSFP